MRWQVLNAVAATLLTSTTTASYVHDQGLPVEKTVTLADGQVIDWIKREIQGEIAKPPASLNHGTAFKKLDIDPFNSTTRGPAGTVPIPRSDGRLPKTKVPPPHNVNRLAARQYANQHWYSSSSQSANSHGSSAALSMFKAYVANSNDFSLLQTAVAHLDVPNVGIQTVEAGWINYPAQVASPHLFTFYTTNAYQSYGDGVSGWNTEYRGWVQYDGAYYPGMELAPLSASEGPMTTTDMGSGHFASEGYGKAAYIRNILITGTDDNDSDYDGSQGVVVSDANRYTIDTHFKSGSTWGSYFFLGGPGAGGVIGG
ncbi:hypothetical protein LLEC1_04884 [Akanthomyces lecanii]|uniref:Neprosin PEP catalytic domain-containing protein n=1 Tax=Cordyceps confragosa TaxID=2714763 RepID=A0A179IBE7_CORDF|nr:hypothetical protein LLEC1_04884 [Akanthomyces lecanii]